MAIHVCKQMVLPFFDYLDILTDSGPKKYIDKLQCLQFRGIKIIYQYCIDGRKIKNSDEPRLHGELGLSYLKCRRNKHILHMMFALKLTCVSSMGGCSSFSSSSSGPTHERVS